MSLMVADTAESPEQTLLAASVEPAAKFSSSDFVRRGGGDNRGQGEAATMHAIAAAAGMAAFAPQWAQAETYHQDHDSDTANAHDHEGRGWHRTSFADLGGAREASGSEPDLHRPAAQSEPLLSPGADRQGVSLSDIIGQHFEQLPVANDPAETHETWSRSAVDRQEGAEARSQDAADSSRHAPQAQAAAEGDAQAGDDGKAWKHGTAGPEAAADHFDGIVDFSNLPSFHAPVNDGGPKPPSLAELKHGDFAGIVDFSRDLLPEPHAAVMPDRAGFKGEGFAHAPAHEPVHVAVNDVIQNMAHDAEAASHHHAH
jgi:hypothetical protein